MKPATGAAEKMVKILVWLKFSFFGCHKMSKILVKNWQYAMAWANGRHRQVLVHTLPKIIRKKKSYYDIECHEKIRLSTFVGTTLKSSKMALFLKMLEWLPRYSGDRENYALTVLNFNRNYALYHDIVFVFILTILWIFWFLVQIRIWIKSI